MASGLLALAHVDFYTAKRMLSDVIDGAYTTLDNDRDDGCRVVLVQSWPTAQRLHSKHGRAVVMIVCMAEEMANTLDAPIIDAVKDERPVIYRALLDKAVIDSTQGVNLELPCVNITKQIIDREVNRLQETQILSHYNTFLYACPTRHRPVAQQAFVDWLNGYAVSVFTDIVKGRTDDQDKLKALTDFMRSERGKYYQHVFSRIFKGVEIEHDLPVFEVAYLTRLRKKLSEAS
jgi:hypothetical protein